jgi:hypothetical protein
MRLVQTKNALGYSNNHLTDAKRVLVFIAQTLQPGKVALKVDAVQVAVTLTF